MADDNDDLTDNAAAPNADGGDANAESIQAMELPDLAAAAADDDGDGSPNLDMIKDIEVTLSVELGRTAMMIDEVLRLTAGKVVELDKLAGEPLDVLINGTVLARGEVVVVDDRFGVRITSITDPRARVARRALMATADSR